MQAVWSVGSFSSTVYTKPNYPFPAARRKRSQQGRGYVAILFSSHHILPRMKGLCSHIAISQRVGPRESSVYLAIWMFPHYWNPKMARSMMPKKLLPPWGHVKGRVYVAILISLPNGCPEKAKRV